MSNFIEVAKDNEVIDEPTENLDSLESAVEDFKKGKMVIIIDREDRENEGDVAQSL